MNCFWHLDTERKFDKGPIPWTPIQDYGRSLGLFEDVMTPFTEIIMSMDSRYLTYLQDINKPPPKSKAKKK